MDGACNGLHILYTWYYMFIWYIRWYCIAYVDLANKWPLLIVCKRALSLAPPCNKRAQIPLRFLQQLHASLLQRTPNLTPQRWPNVPQTLFHLGKSFYALLTSASLVIWPLYEEVEVSIAILLVIASFSQQLTHGGLIGHSTLQSCPSYRPICRKNVRSRALRGKILTET